MEEQRGDQGGCRGRARRCQAGGRQAVAPAGAAVAGDWAALQVALGRQEASRSSQSPARQQSSGERSATEAAERKVLAAYVADTYSPLPLHFWRFSCSLPAPPSVYIPWKTAWLGSVHPYSLSLESGFARKLVASLKTERRDFTLVFILFSEWKRILLFQMCSQISCLSTVRVLPR